MRRGLARSGPGGIPAALAALAKRTAACAAIAAALAGCSSTGSSSVSVTGKTLTIYASVPSQTADPAGAQDVLDAEQLALRRSGSPLGSYKIKFSRLASTSLSGNARTAILDKRTIAYLGELDPGASANSIPITNDQDILQVSPTDNALEYTQSTPAVPGAPKKYFAEAYRSYGYTFARVVPSSALEAQAQVQELRALGVKKLYVADDGSEYGAALADAVRTDAARVLTAAQGPTSAAAVRSSGADALFFGASSPVAAARLFNASAATVPSLKLLGPSALDNNAFASSLGPGARPSTYISAPGFLPADLTAAGRKFVSDFRAAYGHVPAPRAIFGYEAMSAVLAVLHEAGASAGNRATVVHDFRGLKNRTSVLGTYSIQRGNTTLGAFVFSHVEAGVLVPFKFVQAQG
jgi:ABC-type branched-subunit amino acid transport system substrate-binding protein